LQPTARDINGRASHLQELPDVALFFSDVRNLASSKTLKGETSMKRFVMTFALTCVLSCSALAGEVPSVGLTTPPPEETTSTAPGDVPTGGAPVQISRAALSTLLMMLDLL
jgi:hypothetical protein